jgi:septin family protein
MTLKERINFRADLNQRLLHPKPNCEVPIKLFAFSEEVLAAVGINDNNLVRTASMPPPYLVVCSNTCDKDKLHAEEPQFWPERNYDWGTCEAFNPDHSDLLLLRRLLLQEGVEEIARDKVARCVAMRCSCGNSKLSKPKARTGRLALVGA